MRAYARACHFAHVTAVLPAWASIAATKGGSTETELYVVGPAGGSPLYVSGIGFDELEKSLGAWNPANIKCVFTPSERGAKVVKSTTTIVDGVVAGSRLLVCTVPPVADGTTAVVTLEWSGGQAVPLYKAFDGANKLYSATWYAPPQPTTSLAKICRYCWTSSAHSRRADRYPAVSAWCSPPCLVFMLIRAILMASSLFNQQVYWHRTCQRPPNYRRHRIFGSRRLFLPLVGSRRG